MSAKSNRKSPRTSQPNFCANCGTRFPRLNSQQLATHRFCSCCGKPVNSGHHEWLPVTLDEATGTLVHAELSPQSDFSDFTIKERLKILGRHPGKILATGTGAIAIGGGLIFAAAPLAAFGAGVVAAGIVVVKVSLVGGILTGIAAAKTDDQQATGALFKAVGVVAAAGLSTAVAGGIIGFVAALLPLLGGILIGVGALATAGIFGHQAYLQHQARHQRIEVQKNLETALESLSLSPEVIRAFFSNQSLISLRPLIGSKAIHLATQAYPTSIHFPNHEQTLVHHP